MSVILTADSKWSSLAQSYTRGLIVLLILQSSEILGKDVDNFDVGYKWVRADVRQGTPRFAVIGGFSISGELIYVGRAMHEYNLLPAKVLPIQKIAYVSYNGKEYPKYDVDVLVQTKGSFDWLTCSDGYVSYNAIVGGRTASGENLYVGRADYMGSIIVGKIQPSKKGLLTPHNGTEVFFRVYDVLGYNEHN